ncbi:hypothetical protein U9W96_000639 [Enterobacter hormaechei]
MTSLWRVDYGKSKLTYAKIHIGKTQKMSVRVPQLKASRLSGIEPLFLKAPSGGEPCLNVATMCWLSKSKKYFPASSLLMPSLSLIRATMFLAVSIANIMFANSEKDQSELVFPLHDEFALSA